MTIVFFNGSFPPDKCGIGDYLSCLVNELNRNNIKTKVFINNIFGLCFYLWQNRSKGISLNVQYPCANYKNKFLPHIAIILAKIMKVKSSVTVHEYSSLSVKARLFMKIFSISNHIIFTNRYESEFSGSSFKNTKLIPIASNIPKFTPAIEKQFDMCYFGIIAPGKGIESYLEIVENLQGRLEGLSLVLIGFVSEHHPEYSQEIIKRAKSLNVVCIFNKSKQEVSKILASTKISLLPFPDGISERRGSALASMLNGCLVVSYKGDFSSPLAAYTYLGDSRSELESMVFDIITKYENYDFMKEKSIVYAEDKSWANIANSYRDIMYENSSK